MNLTQYADNWINYRLTVGGIRQSTAHNYSIMLRPLLEALGGVEIDCISAAPVRAFIMDDVAKRGHKNARQRHVIAKALFSAAVRDCTIKRNPFDQVDPPKVLRKPATRTLDNNQICDLYKASYEHGLTGLAIRLAIASGLRRGELCALRWADVERNTIHVRHNAVRTADGFEIGEPKTASSIRSVSIPAHLWLELEALRKADDDFVLEGIHPDTLSSRVQALLPKPFTIHDLRHAHATSLLSAGLPVKAVSQRLGHADITTTLRVYAHAMPKDEEAAVAAIDAVVGAGRLRLTASS